jgi:hypothetical protein
MERTKQLRLSLTIERPERAVIERATRDGGARGLAHLNVRDLASSRRVVPEQHA